MHHLSVNSRGPLATSGASSASSRLASTLRARPWLARTMTVTQAANTAGREPPILVSFDVDGTLIHSIGTSSNKLHKQAFCYGLKKVFDLDTHIDVIKHHGGTDPLIILAVLEHHGIPQEQSLPRLKEVEAAMEEYFADHVDQAGTGLELLPGVRDLLTAMQADGGFLTCLVTGNLEPIGWGKMGALGISSLFSNPRFGGFGSDFCSGNTAEMWRDRAQFVRLAASKAGALHPGGLGGRVHVGDTPMDIQAALAAGAGALGVCTGVFGHKDLEAAGPPEAGSSGQLLVLDNFSDTAATLAAIRKCAGAAAAAAGADTVAADAPTTAAAATLA